MTVRRISTSVFAGVAVLSVAACGSEAEPVQTPAPPKSVVVPDVRGERPARAAESLSAAGLQVRLNGGNDRGPGGGQCVVTGQDPAAGATVAPSGTVVLTTGEVGGGPC